jgi:hypothetical protein
VRGLEVSGLTSDGGQRPDCAWRWVLHGWDVLQNVRISNKARSQNVGEGKKYNVFDYQQKIKNKKLQLLPTERCIKGFSHVGSAFVLMPISIFLPKPKPRRSPSLNSIPRTRPETEMQTPVEKMDRCRCSQQK